MGLVGVCTETPHYLEDHPRTCKYLITKVIVSPLRIRLFPFQMAFLLAYKSGWSWLLTSPGMILQVAQETFLCNLAQTFFATKKGGCFLRLSHPMNITGDGAHLVPSGFFFIPLAPRKGQCRALA